MELRNLATITTSWVNIVVKPNALELVSSYPSLRICFYLLTVYVRTASHVTAGTLLVPLALQLPEFGPILVNVWFYLVVIQAQP